MKFFSGKFGGKKADAPDSLTTESQFTPPSRFDSGRYESPEAAAQALLEKRKQLLRFVLAKTIQKNHVPAAWIGGELNPMVLPSGEEWIEVRLSVEVDEPRMLTYLASFQADFERRLLSLAPDARQWLAGITWKLTPDPIYEVPLPDADYWEHVQADRLLTARQKGAAEWDRESLEHHFSDTNPGELVVDFEDTSPPDRDAENIAEPPKKS